MPDANDLDQLTAITVKVLRVEVNELEAVVDGETISEPVLVATLVVVDGNERGERAPQILHLVLDDEQAAELTGRVLGAIIGGSSVVTPGQMDELDASIREAIENGEM